MFKEIQQLSVYTKLGEVMVLKKQNPMPPGYQQLTVNECHWIKNQLIEFLKKNLHDQKIALSSGLIRSAYGSLQVTEQSNNSDQEYYAVLLPNDFWDNIKNFDEITELLKTNEFIFLPIGLVAKVKLENEAPNGFRKMSIQEGQQFKEQLKKLLQTWSIVAFQTGKISGPGYNFNIHDNYGSECGQMFIVSVAPI